MFEDSKTELYVCAVTNGGAAIAALPSNSGGFYKVTDHTLEEGALEAGVEYEFIFRNSAGVLNKSPKFTVGDIVGTPTYQAYVAKVEQVSYVGYNGTSGALDAVNSTYYSIRLVLNHTFGMLNASPMMLTIPYQSDASATQAEVAAGLYASAVTVLGRQPYKGIKVERTNSGALANALGTATATVVNGGSSIVFNEDMTGLVTDGVLLRIGGTGAGTAPVYKVVSNDGGAAAARIYYFDAPYEGATGSIAAAALETVTEGDYGLKFTGVTPSDSAFNPQVDEPFVVSFDVLLGENFVTATVTDSVRPKIGRGTYQQIAAQEAYTQFQNKTREIRAYPTTTYLRSAVAGQTYGVYSFVVQNVGYTNVGSGQRPVSVWRINIAVETSIIAAEAFSTVLTSAAGSTA